MVELDIAQVGLFKELPAAPLKRIAMLARQRQFPAGSVLMRQGEAGDSLYIIVEGSVRVELSHPSLSEPTVLVELGPYEIVGEMAVLDGEPRSATVTAVRDVEALELSYLALATVTMQYPEVSGVLLLGLTRRLRATLDLVDAVIARGRRPGAPGAGQSRP